MSKELTPQQWEDVGYKLRNRICEICGQQGYALSEPNYVRLGDTDALTPSCVYCGHVEIYDVAVLAKMADKINERLIREGQRTRKA